MQHTPPQGGMNELPPDDPIDSNTLAMVLAGVVFALAIIFAGFLILRDRGDSNELDLAMATATPTTETGTSLLSTPTIPAATPSGTPPPSATAAASPTGTIRVFPTLTPAPTPTDEEDDEPTDEPVEEPDDPEETDEPDDVPPTDEPEAEDDPTELPVEEPPAGDFGFLPQPQLPSGGPGSALDLDFQLGTSLEFVPTTATVYEIAWPIYTPGEVDQIVVNLGLDGEIINDAEGYFSVNGSNGSLYISPTVIEFSTAVSEADGTLPSADVAIDAAWSWFSSFGIDGIEAGHSEVVAVEEGRGLTVVAIYPSYPQPNLAPTPSARMKVSSSGTVEEATIIWPYFLSASDYGLRPGIDVWDGLRSGIAYVSADTSESGSGFGVMNVTDISIAYTVAGSPASRQFLVPLVVFGGWANINGVDVWVDAFVPAIYHQDIPQG